MVSRDSSNEAAIAVTTKIFDYMPISKNSFSQTTKRLRPSLVMTPQMNW